MKKLITMITLLFVAGATNAETLICTTVLNQQYKVEYKMNKSTAKLIFMGDNGAEQVIGSKAVIKKQGSTYSLIASDNRTFDQIPGEGQGDNECFKFSDSDYNLIGEKTSSNTYFGKLYTRPKFVFKEGYGYQNCSTPLFSLAPPQVITCKDSVSSPLSVDDMVLAAANKEVANKLSQGFWAGGPPRMGLTYIDPNSRTIPLNPAYPFTVNVKVQMNHVSWGGVPKVWTVQVHHKNNRVVSTQIIDFGI